MLCFAVLGGGMVGLPLGGQFTDKSAVKSATLVDHTHTHTHPLCSVSPLCSLSVCAPCACSTFRGQKEGVRSPGTRVAGSFESLLGCRESPELLEDLASIQYAHLLTHSLAPLPSSGIFFPVKHFLTC